MTAHQAVQEARRRGIVLTPAGANLRFVGPKGAMTPLHVDVWFTHAWLSQLEGRKRWLIFPPGDSQYLYDYQVRCENPDLERFPLYARARPLECTIGPGDTVRVKERFF